MMNLITCQTKKYDEITKAVLDNEGYCPCMIKKEIDTKCICKEFREQNHAGECHCGRYVKLWKNKIKENYNVTN